jgi:regulatory protein
VKKFGPARPGDFRERSRQMRFLQQRGFSAEQIEALFRARD